MSEHDEEYTSSTQEKIKKTGNFKALYNKKYGDIANLSHNHVYTPEQVFDLAVKYFAWAEQNAIKAAETAAFQGVVTENLVHKVRVFTVNGLCLYCNFTNALLGSWRKSPGFSEVMEFVDGVIHEQKYQLAASGLVNAGFVGKDLGIDKPATVNIDNSNSVSGLTPDDMKKAVNDILGEL